jgi:MtN3 and saliva related transmembrane protein
MFEWFGIFGGAIVVSSYLPQIVKLIKTKSSKDISSLFVFFIMLGTLFLGVYSFSINDFIYMIINTIASSFAAIVLFLSLFYKKGVRVESR